MSEIREEKKAQEKEEITVSISPPWISQTEHFRLREIQPLERLHEEILDLVDWLQLDPIDQALRETVYQDVSDVVHKEWPDAVLYCFGSYATGLYWFLFFPLSFDRSLPSSDIDIMIKGLDSTSGLHQVANVRILLLLLIVLISSFVSMDSVLTWKRSHMLASPSSSSSTKYPPLSPFNSIENRTNGWCLFQSREFINFYHFYSRPTKTLSLHEAHDSLLQVHPRSTRNEWDLSRRHWLILHCNDGLGILTIWNSVFCSRSLRVRREDQQGGLLSQKILRFLYFYGYTLNSDTIGLSVMNGGSFFNKEDHDFYDEKRSFLLSIENPFDNELDVGKGSYRYNVCL